MATASFCDPCSDENKSISATNYCSDCEERLCTDCAKSHVRFKAFKSHPVIDLSSVDSYLHSSAKKTCNVHPDMLSDYYCTDHDIICCRACIPQNHRKYENVLPLEHASKDVKNSTLFINVMADMKHLITTLNDLHDNRESNLQSLLKTKSVITKQIRDVKLRLLKQIDVLEQILYAELSSLNLKHEIEIKKRKGKISEVLGSLKASENGVGFLKDYGSDNQLFISLHQQVSNIKSAEDSVLQIISNSQEIKLTFNEKKDIKLECIGTLSESVSSCQIQYQPKKFQQAQIMAQPTTHITRFEMDAELQLKTGISYCLTDICVTDDNKLLLTNDSNAVPKLFVFRDCKDYETKLTFSSYPRCVDVITGFDKAVVTLPQDKSIQFINTKKIIKGDTVNVGFSVWGITPGRDRIYIGGQNGTIKTLDINGKMLKTITLGSDCIYFMSYNDINEQFFVRCPHKLICIDKDGTLVYSKDVSGTAGVTRERQGIIYYGGHNTSNVQRMSSNGENCEEMLNKDNNIDRPYGMCFNNDFTKLFVINKCCTSVFAYNCRY